jgi:hypothetical protein
VQVTILYGNYKIIIINDFLLYKHHAKHIVVSVLIHPHSNL